MIGTIRLLPHAKELCLASTAGCSGRDVRTSAGFPWGAACRVLPAVAGIVLSYNLAEASTYDSGVLTFETQTRQSSWGTGTAQRLSDSIPITTSLDSSPVSAGGIVGSVTTETNPLFTAWETCKLQPVEVIPCGSAPPRTITVDTRTGARLTASTSGEMGVQFDYLLDAGSVDVDLDYSATLDLPDAPVAVGTAVTFNPMADWIDGRLDAQTPTIQASLSSIFELELDVTATACLLGAGCTSGNATPIDIARSVDEVVGVDLNEIRYLDGFLPAGVDISTSLFNQTAEMEFVLAETGPRPKVNVTDENGNRTSLTPSVVSIGVDVASATFTVPIAQETNALTGAGLGVDLREDFLDAEIDIDTAYGLTGGINLGLGPASLSIDGYDFGVGPSIDAFQNLDVESQLFVDLAFSNAVGIGGTDVFGWSGLWSDLPEMVLYETTSFLPTFSVQSYLTNDTGLVLGFEAFANALSLSAGFGNPLLPSLNLGPLLQKTVPFDIASLSLFNDRFLLEGFNEVTTAPGWTVSVFDPDIAVIPLPAGAWLLLSGFGTLVLLRSRRTTNTDGDTRNAAGQKRWQEALQAAA